MNSAVKEDVMDDDEGINDENRLNNSDSKQDVTNDKSLLYLQGDLEGDRQGRDTGVLIAVGKKFSSFDDLETTVTLFEERNFVKFWKREARTIETAKKRVDRHVNPKLKYYELKYTCIHGGQKFRPEGKENRDIS